MNTVRWLTCLAISLAGHLLWLSRVTAMSPGQPTQMPAPVVVANPESTAAPPEQVESPQNLPLDEPAEEQASDDAHERFRPNTETNDEEEEAVTESDREVKEEGPEQEIAEEVEDPEGEQTFTPQERKEAIRDYRGQLLEEFQDQWRKVPELNTVIKDLALVPRIDQCFGVVILAYSFVDHKPGPPFLVFDTRDGSSRKIESFGFDGYSNRIKDRMLYAQYRDWLDRGRREHNINSLMKVIGLVPPETDHYFSSKQLRAVQLAGVPLGQVRSTDGHYEPDGAGGFNLIIDTVVTTDGRAVPIRDEELQFSVVARQ
jgi:hypothetical protein